MSQFEIKLGTDLSQQQKHESVGLFIDGFKHMFSSAKGEKEIKAALMPAFNFSMIYACLDGDKVVGILGIGTYTKRPFEYNQTLCQILFGRLKGNLIYKQYHSNSNLLAVDCPKELFVDFLTTARSMRGKGVATMLLEFSCLLPRFEAAYVEVLSKNKDAKHLYEKLGFSIYKKDYFSLMRLQGHGYPIKMMKDIK